MAFWGLAISRSRHALKSGDIVVEDMKGLDSLSGLDGIFGINGGIRLVNAGFTSLEGLAGLKAVGVLTPLKQHSIYIQDLAQLKNLSGFRGLSGALPGGIYIQRAEALTSLINLEGI